MTGMIGMMSLRTSMLLGNRAICSTNLSGFSHFFLGLLTNVSCHIVIWDCLSNIQIVSRLKFYFSGLLFGCDTTFLFNC